MTWLMIAAHSLDLLTFGIAVAVLPPGYEANPLARAAYAAAGLPGLALLKMGVVWLAIAILGRLGDRQHWSAFGYVLWSAPFVIGVVGCLSNLLAVALWT